MTHKKLYDRMIAFPKSHSFFLFGVRGSGKTSLLKKKFPKAYYIDLLNEKTYQNYLANTGQFYQEASSQAKGSLIIIDEIQRMPWLLNEVHRLIESSSHRFILTGSSARKIRAKGVNLLAGRAGWLNLHPFVPKELGNSFDLQKALKFGLLPVIWSSPDKAFALKAYAQMYLKEEIKAEALVRNLPGFARFLNVASLFHGQVVNMSSIARESAISRDSVRGFFSILEDTLLGFFLPAYSGKIRLREKKHPKFYFIDPGLALALKNPSKLLAKNPDKAMLFEGLVAQILRAYKDYKNLFDEFYYWSPANSIKTEVDFILQRGQKELIAIEVKFKDQVFSNDLKGLKAIADLSSVKRRILIFLGDTKRKTKEGVEIWPFSDFCQALEKNQI